MDLQNLPWPRIWWTLHTIRPFLSILAWKEKNFNLKFIKSAGEINDKISIWIVNKIIDFLNKNKIKPFNKKILILGIAYKKDINDLRESPALKIASLLKKNGYDFEYSTHILKINFEGKIKKNIKINKKI